MFIEPIKKACTLSVRSQIYDGNEPFSKVFSNEYQLKPDVYKRQTLFVIHDDGAKPDEYPYDLTDEQINRFINDYNSGSNRAAVCYLDVYKRQV